MTSEITLTEVDKEPVLQFRDGPRSVVIRLPVPGAGEDRRAAILAAIEIAEEFILEAEDDLKPAKSPQRPKGKRWSGAPDFRATNDGARL